MRALRAFLLRLTSAIHSVSGNDTRDADLREEFESHVAMQTADNIRRGMSPDDARRAALIAAGGMTASAEAVRDRRGLPMLESIATDVRYAIRGLRNKPGFTIAVVLTLALGIGANTAMFTIVNAVVLRSLPYANPDRIISISQGTAGNDRGNVDNKTYGAWRANSRSAMFAQFSTTANAIMTSNGAERVRGNSVRDDYFAVFGVHPLLGHTFTESELALNAPRTVILGETLWRTRFRGDTALLGKSIDIGGVPATVIGVMPASFKESRAEYWLPLHFPDSPQRTFYGYVVARLRDGVSIDAATVEMRTLAQRAESNLPERMRGLQLVVRTLHDRRFGDRRKPLLLLFGAVTVLLLIACANLANLNLARANSRRREVAVRLALGAGRWRIVRAMLSESLLLSLVGAAIGVLVARLSVTYLVHLSPTSVGNAEDVAIDAQVLLFTLAAAVFTGIAFGLSPAITAARGDINSVIGSGGGRAAGGRRFELVRHALVVGQLSTALLLLTVAGLVARSFWNVTSIDAGFRPDHLISATVSLSRRYDDKRVPQFFDQTLSRLRALPGVVDAAVTGALPLAGKSMSISAADSAGQRRPSIDILSVGPRYFETIGARQIAGRSFTAADREDGQLVAILNATMARQLFGKTNPVGQLMAFGSEQRMIVGVFGDVLQSDLEREATPLAYFPIESGGVYPIVVRVTGPTEPVQAAIADIVHSIDETIPKPAFQTGEEILGAAVAPRQFTFVLLGMFAAIAGTLAIVGLYGLLSHLVADRTREIGIRLALGADSQRVLRLVLGQGFVLAVVGATIGLGASLVAVRAAQSLMFGVSVYDASTFVTAAVSLVVTCLVASWLPARRASGVDPIIALRTE